MTTPAIVPVGFFANATDYLKAKVSRDGDAFVNRGVVAIPTGTTTTTIVGIIPFQAGATFPVKSLSVVSDALGTSVTGSLGVIYDDNVNNTNNQTLFASAVTTPAAGGALTIVESSTTNQYVTTGNGWLAFTVGGATTTTAGNISAQALIDYLNGGIQP